MSNWSFKRRAGLCLGLVIALIGALALCLPPEVTPTWWQTTWGVPDVSPTGSSQELTHPAAISRLWVGRLDYSDSAPQLMFTDVVRRNEAALADARVDARAQYRGWMTAFAFGGLILAIMCLLPTTVVRGQERIIAMEAPRRDGEVLTAELPEVAPPPTRVELAPAPETVAEPVDPAQPRPVRVTVSSDLPDGKSSHTMELNGVSGSVEIFFDYGPDGRIKSNKLKLGA